MPQRRSPAIHRYTTDYRLHERQRTPFIRMTGRWLEAFGFTIGTKFTAVGDGDGRLILTVVKPEAPSGTTKCHRSCTRRVQNRALRSRPNMNRMRFRFYVIAGDFHPTGDRIV
jgi:hypothetical protein